MRLLDQIRNAGRKRGEAEELSGLQARLDRYSGVIEEEREALIDRCIERTVAPELQDRLGGVLRWLLSELLAFEGLFSPPAAFNPPGTLSTSEVWAGIADLNRRLAALENPAVKARVEETLAQIICNILPEELPRRDEEGSTLEAPLVSLLSSPARAVEGAMGSILGTTERGSSPFPALWARLELNLLVASGINPEGRASSKMPVFPTKAEGKAPGELVAEYLGGTPLQGYFETPVPFSLPLSSRFEHTHIIGGSGHGKTQLLQSLLLRDLEQLSAGRGSVVVIDSQGDLIRNILNLSETGALSDRLVLLDPNDIEYPPCLNLFDFGLDRLGRYDAVEREKLINGAIALYEYMFGALLGAELTQRQGVIFRYLARLLMVVPGATIHTLREFMQEPEKAREYLSSLDETSRIFFETQFFSKRYDDTRSQILTRLWGIISNSVLARMFSHKKNSVDLFASLNRGSLVLVNTAKDLLKQEGCSLFGRFFIALLVQAVQERSAIPEGKRRSTFVYIDEAQDYFDQGIENLLNTARKYRTGLVLAHQNLGQFGRGLEATVMASTAVKLVGGVSAGDGAALSREMRCEPEFLLSMRKRRNATEFACFIRNVTPSPVALSVPFGQMEGRPRISEDERRSLIARNRTRVSVPSSSSSSSLSGAAASAPSLPLQETPTPKPPPGRRGRELI